MKNIHTKLYFIINCGVFIVINGHSVTLLVSSRWTVIVIIDDQLEVIKPGALLTGAYETKGLRS